MLKCGHLCGAASAIMRQRCWMSGSYSGIPLGALGMTRRVNGGRRELSSSSSSEAPSCSALPCACRSGSTSREGSTKS
eukprot:3714768-Pleurochrysis_carterae.AAC.1